MRADLPALRKDGRALAVARAKASRARRTLRDLEHRIDVDLRGARLTDGGGVRWAEVRRGRCGCGIEARLWVGSRVELGLLGVAAIVSTPFLCALCVVRTRRTL